MRPDAPLLVIVNERAGGASQAPLATRIEEAFRSHGLEARIAIARDDAGVAAQARETLAHRPSCIVAGGGDGTINRVAGHLVGTTTRLGVLPMGTLNHFARDAGIPFDLDAAVACIAAGHTRTVDVARVNDRIFLNNSSLGLYPSIVRMRDEQQQRLGRGKWPAFFWALMLALRHFAVVTVELEADGARLVRRTPVVFIGNNEYTVTGLAIGQRARLDGGRLALYMPRALDRGALLMLALRALVSRGARDPDLESITVKAITVRSHRHAMLVSLDGEVVRLRTPLDYAILPGALQVIVPAPPDETAAP
jgi:YegS/Rv2252/BmrU family lipid kinase